MRLERKPKDSFRESCGANLAALVKRKPESKCQGSAHQDKMHFPFELYSSLKQLLVSSQTCSTRLAQLLLCIGTLVVLGSAIPVHAQDEKVERVQRSVPTIDKFTPQSMLKVKRSELKKARAPVIDIHGHFGFRLKGDSDALQRYVEVMDRNNIALSISLDAILGKEEDHLKFLQPFANRFLVFCHIDFIGNGNKNAPKTHACNQPGFVRNVCRQLESAKSKGIVGLKFFKQFGLGYKNRDGSLIRIDDQRFDPIWQTCGKLGFPVIIHTADPAAFFEPIDENNERYEELLRHPDWSFFGDAFPSRKELLDARNNVIRRHPKTVFIGAHLANNPEDLDAVGKWLDELPNLVVEFSSRIAELGRQPFTAKKFFIKYQDRILFGTDGPWPEQRLFYYWRFLETADEYFPYSEKSPQPQGLWFIYGMKLPKEVLNKVYFENAFKVLPSAKLKYPK